MLAAVVPRHGVAHEIRENVDARDQVLMTFFSPLAFMASTQLQQHFLNERSLFTDLLIYEAASFLGVTGLTFCRLS